MEQEEGGGRWQDVTVGEIWCTCAGESAGDKQWQWFLHVTALTRKVHVNMSDVMGLASATHIRSAISPRFTNTGSFCGRTLGASDTKTARQRLRQDKSQAFQ